MLIVRAILFTILVPGVVTIYVPSLLLAGTAPPGAWRFLGLLLIAAGALGYLACVLEFLLRGGGTPAVFFTRPLRFLIGEEPKTVVQTALYQRSRNPMYVSVVTVVLGESLFFESLALLYYALFLWLMFHLVVVFVEEPHLRERPDYAEYCARVPRWLFPSWMFPNRTVRK
jgi:protein-S-isoprenylcysteine O-methyltransferase Ste14